MESLSLSNFRCYAQQDFTFKPGINLLIGDNASGKTSVLLACKYVLSAFFAGFSDENTKWITPGTSDFREELDEGQILPEKPVVITFEGLTSSSSLFPESECYIQKNSKKNSRALTSGIKMYKLYSADIYDKVKNGQPCNLPLFACFTTEDIHATRKINDNAFLRYAQKRSFGYYECLTGNGLFPYWQKRLLVLKEGRKQPDEIEAVRQAIVAALGHDGCDIIYDMEVRPIQKRVYYILKDGREVEAGQLSDGYRRLVNIVTDIAFRSALLNRSQPIADAKGTVLIDEIDLHLHPKLQANVLKGLRHAFPNIQFIVTTHAPMVMTGVEDNDENIVYRLDFSRETGYTVEPIQTYGMDVSTITETVLDQNPPRDKAVDSLLQQLFDSIDSEQWDEARQLLTSLRDRFGARLPELSRAEAMLNFMMDDLHD